MPTATLPEWSREAALALYALGAFAMFVLGVQAWIDHAKERASRRRP